MDKRPPVPGGDRAAPHAPYRLSDFCVTESVDAGVLLCQSATGALVLLTGEEYRQLADGPVPAEPWTQTLAEMGFLREPETDERAEVDEARRQHYEAAAAKGRITDFTILPTTRCNARCFYCYEHGIPQKNMSPETAEAVAAFIIRMSQGHPVHLGWFGGEPTIAPGIISRICRILEQNAVAYRSGMISNGLRLDPDMIQTAKDDWHLRHVQITLDGTEAVYNKVKDYKGKPGNPFRTVLSHIGALLEADIRVSVRINLGLHNTEDVRSLIGQLAERFPGQERLLVYVHEIDNYYGEAEQLLLLEQADALNEQLIRAGMQRPQPLPALRLHSCMADRPDSVVINPDGALSKCEHYVYDKLCGAIGSGETDAEMLLDWRRKAQFPGCGSCPLYASCLRLRWCSGESFVCTEGVLRARLRQTRNSMRRIHDRWQQTRRELRQNRQFRLSHPYRIRRQEAVFFRAHSEETIAAIPVNQTSLDILERLRDGASFPDIVEALEERCNADAQVIGSAVEAYLLELVALEVCTSL